MMDAQLLFLITETRGFPPLDALMVFVSWLGNNGLIWILVTVGLLIHPKTRKYGFVCAAALLLSLLFCNVILKNLVARPRPYDTLDWLNPLVKPLSDYSFPSGHTSASFASATAIFFSGLNKKWGIAAFILAALISFSRLYVGVHYPTDILGGIFTGVLSGYLAFSVRLLSKKT